MSDGYIEVTYQLDSTFSFSLGYHIGAFIYFSDFAVNHADLPINHSAFLDAYAAYLFNIPGGTFEVTGFASLTGPADYNLALSKQRAQSVASGFISRGASEDQIKVTEGLGQMDIAGTGEREAYQDRCVGVQFYCPREQADALTDFQTRWNSGHLKQQATAPPEPDPIEL